MESSQPARLGAWLGQVGGKSAPEVKRTSPPGNSTVPSRLAQSRCSSMAWREGGAWVTPSCSPAQCGQVGFTARLSWDRNLAECVWKAVGSYSETLARLSPVSEGRVARENKVGWSYMQAARQSHRSEGAQWRKEEKFSLSPAALLSSPSCRGADTHACPRRGHGPNRG